jgi:hypothetical protein
MASFSAIGSSSDSYRSFGKTRLEVHVEAILAPWVVASTLLLFVAAYWIYTLERRLGTFEERYGDLLSISESLSTVPDQAVLLPLVRRLDAHDIQLQAIAERQQRITTNIPHMVQGLGVVRYNAFEGVGGDQSFSLALVDAVGHGAILTGLHGGDDMRVYAKPIKNWRSTYSLSADEQRALAEARSTLSEAVDAKA